MKLIGCILAGAVFAQEQTTIYSLDDISLDELARGRKKKKQVKVTIYLNTTRVFFLIKINHSHVLLHYFLKRRPRLLLISMVIP